MKIGIVTFYGVANYGAMLQAYALWKYLESRGHSVEFVDVLNYRSLKTSLYQCLLSRSLKSARLKFQNFIQQHITDFAAAYPQTRRFAGLDDLRDNCPKYDVLIVGSDQMWNPKWCAADAIPVVFLDFAPRGCGRISYAASFGVVRWEQKESAKIVGRLLREFQAISVREKSGIEVVRDLSGRRAECLLDPTLLWDRQFYQKLMSKDDIVTRPYVFYYVLQNWTDGELEANCLASVVRQLGVDRVLNDSCPPRGLFASLARMLGIKDRITLPAWLKRIACADFVVTNSFHGTVFSILFQKPFITVLIRGKMNGMNERVFTLLENLGLSARMVNDERSIEGVIRSTIDWTSVFARLKALRGNVNEFFEQNSL